MDSENPVGRPSLYRPEYCQMLLDHMEKGLSFEAFGGVVRVSKQTLYDWMLKHPEFLDSVLVGKSLALLRWEECGMDMMMGRIPFGSAQVYALNMRNRFKWDQPDSAEEKNKPKQMVLNYDPKKRPKKEIQ